MYIYLKHIPACCACLLPQLEIQDLQCLGACRVKEMVTALQFVSRSVLACCFFSHKSRKAANYRRLRGVGKVVGSVSTSDSVGNGVDEKTQKGRGKTEEESSCATTSKKWFCKDIPCMREAEALPDRLGEIDGKFCLSFIKVSTGTELASVRDLPFRKATDFVPEYKNIQCYHCLDCGGLCLLRNIFVCHVHVKVANVALFAALCVVVCCDVLSAYPYGFES